MNEAKKELTKKEEDNNEVISGFEDFLNENRKMKDIISTKILNSSKENLEDYIIVSPKENQPKIINLVQMNILKEEKPLIPEKDKKEIIKEKEVLNSAKKDIVNDIKKDIVNTHQKGENYKIEITNQKIEKKNENISSNKEIEDKTPVLNIEKSMSVEDEIIQELFLAWENNNNIRIPIQSFEKSKRLYYPFNIPKNSDDFLTEEALNIERNVSNYRRKRKRPMMLFDESIYERRDDDRFNLFYCNGSEPNKMTKPFTKGRKSK